MSLESKKKFLMLSCVVALLFQVSCSHLPFSARAQFDRNRGIWRASGTVNYKMSVKINKTGHATPNGTVEIVVRDGITESIKRIENPSVGIDLPRWSAYDSIDEIFGFMEKSIDGPLDKLEVEYDPQLGFPRKLDIDPERTTSDDELFFQVIMFEGL